MSTPSITTGPVSGAIYSEANVSFSGTLTPAVPEPASLGLFAVALAGLAAAQRGRRRRAV